ncbi:beta-ketoacyl-[acyl-carrier-protein] synthase family protein [Desulfovibrio sp. OttesenSCG-928-C06]|nr:beta-ketoacyl-[acyl-carrier-protein] synthase family protein [Desulfovibrio sp. OttesenSCG-928-C06]
MRKRRVVITGIGAVSPFGWDLPCMAAGMEEGNCALSLLPESARLDGMQVKVCGVAPEFNSKSIPREHRRAMSHMGIMAYVAASEALRTAGITPDTPLAEAYRGMGSCIASTTVSPNTLEDFFRQYLGGKMDTVRSTVFFKVMGHAVPSNINVTFGLSGRCISPAAACASGLQAIGLAYEQIAFGRAGMMLCGGVEEYHALLSATFDRIGAASHNASPDLAARPFDSGRDGIVCGEGAGIFLLEEYESARERGANIIAEIAGFGTNTAPSSIVFPDSGAIEGCMRMALEDAAIAPEEVQLVNAHATATESGDIAEGLAIERLFGSHTPVNSLKGYMGHCMAASGSLELAAAITAARDGFVHGTRNLTDIDPRCGKLMLDAEHKKSQVSCLLKNSFGLGGVNASLVVKL